MALAAMFTVRRLGIFMFAIFTRLIIRRALPFVWYGQRPKECAEFPRGPDDLDRVKQYCSIRFVDENGRVVDSWMDPHVRLAPVKKPF